MARPLRLDAPGLTHHITSRGNERKRIFRDDRDCEKFLELLEETVRRFNWIVHAWVLMINHFHLVVETREATLSDGMHFLDGEYAKWVNRKRKRSGHLFQGRFHSFLIEKQAYLMEVMRYVALNPVRAKLAARPEEWRWSSYRSTAGFDAAPGWLETDWILAQIRSDRAEAQQVYREFVCEKIGDKTCLWDSAVHQIYLGTEAWVERLRGVVESKPRSDEHPRAQRSVGRPSIQKIVSAVANVFDIDRRDLQHGHGGAPRSILAWLARYEGLAKLRSITAALRLRSSGHVSDLINGCDRDLARDSTLRGFVDRCLEFLRSGSGGTNESPFYWPAVPLPITVRETAPSYLA